ncbi:MAG TPA: Hpt domain-containing protein [Methylomirabilota bacterium]|jgi:HPt (histidine-containing phosphotransfer) domain-containing protein
MTDGEPILDLAALLHSVGGDGELLDELSGTFVAEAPGWIAALRAAVSSGDSAAVFRVAHGVRGAVGYFKATSIRQVAADLEVMGRDGNLEMASAALDELQAKLLELSAFLSSRPWSQ